jgi:hypothetical protein
LLAACVYSTQSDAGQKPARFWNLTGETITRFRLAPAGTEHFGPDQCANDRDGAVDYDERLRIGGIDSGYYDAQIQTKHGLICTVKNLDIKIGEVFSIEQKDLVGCQR